jgi:hypothetical protein
VNAVHPLGFVTLVLARAILLDALGNARHPIDRSEHGRELAHRDLSAPECLDDGIERHLRVVGAADVRQRERERERPGPPDCRFGLAGISWVKLLGILSRVRGHSRWAQELQVRNQKRSASGGDQSLGILSSNPIRFYITLYNYKSQH